ncbi:hypothetical protein [Chengkuizengella sediminis]|uniref:hypothetical protein n=1 Tax=Chengkuizengella sediminis TaxID=1885917 RepID=UPI00138A2394|nr:hypothetical protein [Chengkuizengella sediminis]NDI35366.1 hypothetical protein [Chengkuizengella sediminis]
MIPVDSFSLPVYLLIAWGSAAGSLILCLSNIHKYNKFMLLGILLVSFSAFFAGLFRLSSELELFQKYIGIIEILPLLGIILGSPLLLIGSYIQAKDDPYRKKLVIFGSGLVIFGFFVLAIIIVLALMGLL